MYKSKLKSGILIVALFVCLALVGALTVNLIKSNNESDTRRLSFISYSIGTLDNVGDENESNFAFRTDYIKSDKVDKIELEKGSTLKYKVYFYDSEKFFLSSTDFMSTFLTGIPKTAVVQQATDKYLAGREVEVAYCRVVCEVPDDKEKVSFITLPAYSNQIVIMLRK